MSNLLLEFEDILTPQEVESTIDYTVYQVMEVFLDKDSGLIYENVIPDGSRYDSFDGRLLNPGHNIEVMWFLINTGVRKKNVTPIEKTTQTILTILKHSWDRKYRGIFYFMDAKGYPPFQSEWRQKLWGIHLEVFITPVEVCEHSPNKEIWHWYQKVHDYAWSYFSDPENGEWFGYLNRQGEVLLNLKDSKWKGFFQVPGAMYQCWKSFERIEVDANE